MFNYKEHVLTGDATSFYKRKTIELPARTAQSFNNVMTKLTAHVFPVHAAYYEQTRYMRRILQKLKETTAYEYLTRVR